VAQCSECRTYASADTTEYHRPRLASAPGDKAMLFLHSGGARLRDIGQQVHAEFGRSGQAARDQPITQSRVLGGPPRETSAVGDASAL
jgi:hypothetical protein